MNRRRTLRRSIARYTVNTVLLLAAGTLAATPALLLSQTRQLSQTRKPNIVLIVSDDQGYADLGCCGRPELKTPNLDKLVSEGVRLTSFYVSWPACTPSRGSFLTGRYPQRNGLYDMIRNNTADYGVKFTPATYAVSPEMTLGLDLREVTIAQVLKKAGYQTGIFGKWDSGRARRFLPLQRGFDAFFGFCNTGIDYFTHERYGYPSMFRNNDEITEDGYATGLFAREALAFIRRNHQRPFFLYVPFNAPHGASNFERAGAQAPDEYIRMYGGKPPGNRRERYLGSVTSMDHAIGQILAELDKHRLTNDTLVIFFSDNGGSGDASNGPLRGRKAQMFEGGIRVLAAVRWPGRIPAGKVNDEFLAALEVLPTLAGVAGAALPGGVILDGFDMLPVLRGKVASERKEMYWQRRDDKAARYENWKWVESEKGSGLFDLSKDIGERNDLSEVQPQMLKKMKSRWAAWRKEMNDAEVRGPFRNY